MSDLLAGLLAAALATNQSAAVSNLILERTGVRVEVPNPNDPVEQEYQKLLAADDAAHAEIDRWIQDDQRFRAEGAGLTSGTLRPRIKQRLEPVRQRYEEFLQRHPDHVRARIAYGSFLNDLGEEESAALHWERARELDPKNPAVWNNLANYYGHNGDARKAIEFYSKAIELAPGESVYYQNLAVTVYLFRKDAMAYYGIGERHLFNKVLALYRRALALDPSNFPLATELAQTYYGFKPDPGPDAEATLQAERRHYDEALTAWHTALKLARDDIEREGTYIHLARVNLMAGRLDEARRYLNLVTNAMYGGVKQRLQKNLLNRDTQALSVPPVTLRPPAEAATPPPAEDNPLPAGRPAQTNAPPR